MEVAALRPDLGHVVQQFLFKEAQLLDERRFEEWLELFTSDLHYWMPGRFNSGEKGEDGVFKSGDLALFEESKQTLINRVARFRTGLARAEEPPSRTRHLITNVQAERGERAGELRVRSNFLVYRTRLEHDMDTFVGCRDDIFREVDGHWKIARRTILLDQAVLSASNLSVFF